MPYPKLYPIPYPKPCPTLYPTTQEGLKEEDVCLWLDWQSIYQDDKAEKLKGVQSLIQFAAMSQYMLVPTEESTLEGDAAVRPHHIPAYGGRGWDAPRLLARCNAVAYCLYRWESSCGSTGA